MCTFAERERLGQISYCIVAYTIFQLIELEQNLPYDSKEV